MSDRALLKFQLGPVQEFIDQARSTRDLWSGSYMLSWLVAHAICAVIKEGGLSEADVQMPSLVDNPLITALRDPDVPLDLEQVLVPNIPNKALFSVPVKSADRLAEAARDAVVGELKNMGDAVWHFLVSRYGAQPQWRIRWVRQLAVFPKFTYAWVPWNGRPDSWNDAYKAVDKLLAARRNTREFFQWVSKEEEGDLVKDSLSGREERIGNDVFWRELRSNVLFNKAKNHCYGAVNLVKRLWCHVDGFDEDCTSRYLANAINFNRARVRRSLRVPTVPDIAAKNIDAKSPYVAVLAFDGDQMGAAFKAHAHDAEGLRRVSQALSTFDLKFVRGIVESHLGHLIYAGGDDVLAILPSSRALACAQEIRRGFCTCGSEFGLDGSCGIVVGHMSAPLQQLVREAKRMEHVAKDRYGRKAVAISLYKRSGEIIEWGNRWDEGGALDLMKEVTELSQREKNGLPGRFPYALAGLISPYFFGKKETDISFESVRSVMKAETRHVLGRQGRFLSEEDMKNLVMKCEEYIDYLVCTERYRPNDYVNLFLAETFINRMREDF